jgi:hypothetical protein
MPPREIKKGKPGRPKGQAAPEALPAQKKKVVPKDTKPKTAQANPVVDTTDELKKKSQPVVATAAKPLKSDNKSSSDIAASKATPKTTDNKKASATKPTPQQQQSPKTVIADKSGTASKPSKEAATIVAPEKTGKPQKRKLQDDAFAGGDANPVFADEKTDDQGAKKARKQQTPVKGASKAVKRSNDDDDVNDKSAASAGKKEVFSAKRAKKAANDDSDDEDLEKLKHSIDDSSDEDDTGADHGKALKLDKKTEAAIKSKISATKKV